VQGSNPNVLPFSYFMCGREGYATHEDCYSLCVAYSRPGDPIFNWRPCHCPREAVIASTDFRSHRIGHHLLHMRNHKTGGGLARAKVPKVAKYQLLRGRLRKIGRESRPEATKRMKVKASPESTLTGRGGKEAASQGSKCLGTSVPSLFASR
jgi:hypothetical protein